VKIAVPAIPMCPRVRMVVYLDENFPTKIEIDWRMWLDEDNGCVWDVLLRRAIEKFF
jgi:hypothetical protein